MKRILLAAALGIGVITFSMGSSHATAPAGQLKYDTVPNDTTKPAPKPDSTSTHFQ